MGSLNRRALFGVAPAVALAGLPAVVGASIRSDTGLQYLGSRYEEACAAYDAASKQEDEAEERFVATHIPKPVAHATEEDIARGIGAQAGLAAGERIPWVEVVRVNRNLRDGWTIDLTSPLSLSRARWAEKYAALMATHRANEKAVQDRVGLTAAEARAQEALRVKNEIEEAIVAAPCSTMAGLRVKAMVAKRLVPGVDDTENDWHDTAALSVIDVLLRMGAN